MAKRSGVNLGSAKKPKLGQNFLTDAGVGERVVDDVEDISQSLVLEIGPGKGALTKTLARPAGRLIAVELDRMMATELRFLYSGNPKDEILERNALNIDFRTGLHRTMAPLNDLRPLKPAPARVTGNLPY